MSRIAAMDISPNRIGIAFSNLKCTFCAATFLIKKSDNFRKRIKELYDEYNPSITYIGLPINLDDSTSEQTKFVKTFTHNIRDIIGHFIFKDERWTTQIAKKTSLQYKSIDEIVALNSLNEEIIKINHIEFT